jgi:hypothetical protein
MTPHPQPTTRTRITRATLLLAIGGALFFLAMPGAAVPPADPGADAVITVEFSADDMGFNVTSTKGISNVWVLFCERDPHKHEFSAEILFFNHTETDVVTGVYVKSGNNGVDVPGLGGAGEFFANEGVDCSSETTTSTSDTDTETSGSETETETSGSETETETSGSETETETSGSETDSETSGSETQTETEEIPVFGTATTLALGVGGALGGTLLMLRRRL